MDVYRKLCVMVYAVVLYITLLYLHLFYAAPCILCCRKWHCLALRYVVGRVVMLQMLSMLQPGRRHR